MLDVWFAADRIDALQRQAGERIVLAAEQLSPGLRCALGTEPSRTAPSGRTPTPATLRAAETLKEVEGLCGWLGWACVRRVIIQGLNVQLAAAQLFTDKSTRSSDFVGRLTRESLSVLADAWWPSRPRRNRVYRAAGAVPTDVVAGTIEPAAVVGATAHTAFRHGRFEVRRT